MTLAIGFWTALLISWTSSSIPVQEATIQEIMFHRVHLKNGNFIDGRLLWDTSSEVALEVKIGQIVLRRDLVERVELVRIRHISEPRLEMPRPAVQPQPPQPPSPVPKTVPSLPESPSPAAPGVPEELRRKAEAILAMAELTSSKEDHLAMAAKLTALGKDILPYLHAYLDRTASRNAIEVILLSLAGLRDPSSIPALVKAGQLPDASLRELAVKALSALGLPECIHLLMEALDDDSIHVTWAAQSGLAKMAAGKEGAKVAALLGERLQKAKNKGVVATTLGRLGHPQGREFLVRILESRDENLIPYALEGMIWCATAEDGPLIQRVLNSETPSNRSRACAILGKIRHKPAIGDLIECLREEDKDLVSGAHAALKAISGENFGPDPDTWRNWWENAGRQEP